MQGPHLIPNVGREAMLVAEARRRGAGSLPLTPSSSLLFDLFRALLIGHPTEAQGEVQAGTGRAPGPPGPGPRRAGAAMAGPCREGKGGAEGEEEEAEEVRVLVSGPQMLRCGVRELPAPRRSRSSSVPASKSRSRTQAG